MQAVDDDFSICEIDLNCRTETRIANKIYDTRSYGRSPCQPIVKSAVAIKQPKFISSARKSVLKLDHITDIGGGYSGIWWWITYSRAVIQAIPGASLAQVSWYLDGEIRRICDLNKED